MIVLHENEIILKAVRKHWFVMARAAAMLFVLILVPVIMLTFSPMLAGHFDPAQAGALINFALAIYLNIVLGLAFFTWTDYYLDMWVLTDQRIIDVEQHGLFHREISEIPLSRVQDVTVEIRGLVETILHFGTIKVQTAGEREFSIRDVPHLNELKDLILRQIKLVHQPNSREQQNTKPETQTLNPDNKF